MKKTSFLPAVSLAVLSLVFSTVSPSYGGDENSRGSEKNKSSELASTYDSKYWGTPSRDITNSDDQSEYDRNQIAIPGIEVASSEVFSVFPGRKASNAAAVVAGSGDLKDHGGTVLSEIHIYPIFWGPATTLTPAYTGAITNFFSAIQCGGTAPACIGQSDLVKQYFRGASSNSPIIKYVKSYTDTTNPPVSSPSTASIVAEAAKVVKAAAGDVLDTKGLYLVFTSNYPSRVKFCGWHSAGSYQPVRTTPATWFTVSYMPYLGGTPGCSASYLPRFNGFVNGQAVHSVINVATHELFETMSDSVISNRSAWFDAAGFENGDKCAWNFGSTMAGYRVQSEYSNFHKGCPDLTS
ncbi:unannotated protein [freshwater metagenome]|uniref:Unannotated protein n=1 Tax=freshwater metagenome TaxID=449393 RepID=A0A6J7DYP0_9ZZZZ|nr:hypothetical protein [Actinomycetota bacterium]